MTFSAWLENIYAKVSADIDALPQWKRDALARDEAYLEKKRKGRGRMNSDFGEVLHVSELSDALRRNSQLEAQIAALNDVAMERDMANVAYDDAKNQIAALNRLACGASDRVAALTKQVEELTGERDRSREARRNHAETLRGIARMDPTTDGERMRQWARDGLSGYVATYEMTLREFEQRFEKAEAELAALREGAKVTYRVERAGSVGHKHIRETLEDARQALAIFSHRSGYVWQIVEVTAITRERILDEKGEG